MANAIQQIKFQIQAPITKHYASAIKELKLLLLKLVSLFASRNSQSLYSCHCDVLGIVRNIEVGDDVIVAIHECRFINKAKNYLAICITYHNPKMVESFKTITIFQ